MPTPHYALRSPTGFTVRHTARLIWASARDGAGVVLRKMISQEKRRVPRPGIFMPSGEEIAHALIGVAIDTTKHRSTRPIAEVREQLRRVEQRLHHPERERMPTKAHASTSCNTIVAAFLI